MLIMPVAFHACAPFLKFAASAIRNCRNSSHHQKDCSSSDSWRCVHIYAHVLYVARNVIFEGKLLTVLRARSCTCPFTLFELKKLVRSRGRAERHRETSVRSPFPKVNLVFFESGVVDPRNAVLEHGNTAMWSAYVNATDPESQTTADFDFVIYERLCPNSRSVRPAFLRHRLF